MTQVGIDIGTSSTKLCVINNNKIICEFREIYSTPCSSVQDATIILNTAANLLKRISHNYTDLWICGQMHGIILWNSETVGGEIAKIEMSPLYNWMFDNDPEFLKSLPKWQQGKIHPGFGLPTLAYLQKTQAGNLKIYNRCGTIMDLFCSHLSKTSKVYTSPHNAHSWAYCDANNLTWDSTIRPFLPSHIQLPQIVPIGTVIGKLRNRIRIHVASGDLQASVASLPQHTNTAYIIIGTSAQLCSLIPINQSLPESLPSTVVILPYSKTHQLVAACAMNGGSALEAILTHKYSRKLEDGKLIELLHILNEKQFPIPPNTKMVPIFINERGSDQSLVIEGIEHLDDVTLLEATHRGIISNLFTLFPSILLHHIGIRQIALVGAANENRFKRHISAQINLPLLHNSTSPLSTPIGATKL